MSEHPTLRRVFHLLSMLWLVLAAAHPVGARGTEAYPNPFEDARHIPASVTQYFCFVEAGGSLSDLLDSSLAPGLNAFYERCASGRSWRELAAATGIESSTLFEMLVSKRATLVTDQDVSAPAAPGAASDYSRWVLMARVDEPFARELLKLLGGRVREFVDDVPLYAAENGSLRFAYRDDRFYLSAANGEALLRSMLARTIESTLADDEEFREARRVGPGDFGMFKRGTGDVHWQAGSAKVKRDRVYLNFVSKHEPRGVVADPGDAINLGLLGALAEDAIYVGVERTPQVDGRVCERSAGPTLLPLVPIARAKPAVLSHLGPTMFTVIELPAGGDAPGDGVPAMTIGIEMRQPDEAIRELDDFMGVATARLSKHRRDQSARLEQPPAVSYSGADPEALRTAEWRGSGLPMRLLGLDGAWPEQVVWSSVLSEDRAWWVASTDEQSQRRIAGKLKSYSAERCNKSSSTQARGVVFGGRLAALVARWPAVTSEASHPFVAELFAWRELLTAVSEIRWRVTHSSPERTETGISVAWNNDSRK